MKRFLVFASLVLVAVACKTPQERAEERLNEISEAAKRGDMEEVKDRVEQMTIWYEGLSSGDKKQIDREYNKQMYEQAMARAEAQERAEQAATSVSMQEDN